MREYAVHPRLRVHGISRKEYTPILTDAVFQV